MSAKQQQTLKAKMAEVATQWKRLSDHERGAALQIFLPYVDYICRRMARYFPPTVDFDDLVQSGTLGLLEALPRFDPEKGTQVQTFLEHRIRGAVLDYLRALDWVPRSTRAFHHRLEQLQRSVDKSLGRRSTTEEVAVACGCTLEEFSVLLNRHALPEEVYIDIQNEKHPSIHETLLDENAIDPLQGLLAAELERIISRAIRPLPLKERLVISLYFFEDLTMGAVGNELGLTESRISQIITKVLLQKIAPLLQQFIAHR